jgi:hypothetical protein
LAWLKSTKMRSPRSSFHQFVVTRSGIRRSSSRPAAMTACRTSRNSCVGSIGQNTWMPRLPLVFSHASSPASRRRRAARARPPRHPRNRSRLRVEVDAQLDGVVGVGRERGPRVEDDGVHLHRPDDRGGLVEDDLRMPAPAVVRAHDLVHVVGRPLGRVLREEALAVDRVGEPLERDGPVPVGAQERLGDGATYSASSRFVMPSSGQITRFGLDSDTSRAPSGPATVRVMRSDAMRSP